MAGLIQQCRNGGAVAIGAAATGGTLFPESAHAERPADRFGGAVSPSATMLGWRLGDLSPKGLCESAGILVNYLYRLDGWTKSRIRS
jgi:hypothetical protein